MDASADGVASGSGSLLHAVATRATSKRRTRRRIALGGTYTAAVPAVKRATLRALRRDPVQLGDRVTGPDSVQPVNVGLDDRPDRVLALDVENQQRGAHVGQRSGDQQGTGVDQLADPGQVLLPERRPFAAAPSTYVASTTQAVVMFIAAVYESWAGSASG